MKAEASNDAWYESEESPRLGMIVEVQRIRRRMRARPLPVILLAIALAALGIRYVATRKPIVEAEVVLALSEGSLSKQHQSGLPVDELRDYVANVLIPDSKLLALIEKRDLFKNRKKFGDRYAIDGLRDQFDIQIWKNTFLSYEEELHSARIGLTVADTNPDHAFDLARDLATIVIETSQEQRQQVTKELANEMNDIRERLRSRLDELTRQTAEKEIAQRKAHETGREAVAQAIELELATMWREQTRATKTLQAISMSQDTMADEIAAAGLDINISVVEEHRPPEPDNRGFAIVLVSFVIAIASLLGAALFVGAFDSRVHDTEDIERLGLAVLGHVPTFAGDHVGSLQDRGVRRGRVPLFKRLKWLSRR